MICPKCHYSVRESDLYCGHCGCFLEKAGQGENRSGLSSKEEQEGMLDKFIGIDGRINRKKYIFSSLLLWGMGCIFELCVIMGRVEQLDFMAGDLPGLVLLTMMGIPGLMLMVRRLHDLNRNGFWSLLVFAGLCAGCFVLPLPLSLLFSWDEREKLVWRGSARKESGYVGGGTFFVFLWRSLVTIGTIEKS